MTSFALEPIYGSLLLTLVAGIATIAVILAVTPPTENPSHRHWLIALRLFAASVLLLAAFRPTLLRTDTRPADAALVVAVDTSRSMTLPDGDGSTRWMAQSEAWKKLVEGLSGLDGSLVIRLLAYDASARKLASATADALDAESPAGELTDLSAAAVASIQAAEGQPIAGVVLMGDGTQTAPLKGTGAQRVVETLNSIGVPLWTVPIGPPGGASASRDVAVDSLEESYQLFAGNEFEIQFQVLARGLAGEDIPVRLSWIDIAGKTTEVASRNVAPSKSSEVTALSVSVLAPDPGTYRLKVEAETQEGELITTNNLQIAFVEVREGGGRILYLEGTQRQEQTFVRRSLRRFPDLDLTYRWIPKDTSATWPIDLNDSFRPGKFDIYVIGDLDASALGDAQLRELADTVSAGAGLVMLGGYQTFGAGGYASSPLAEVIPVRMDASRRRSMDAGSEDSADQLAGPLPLRLARNHPITDLGTEDPSLAWTQLPPLLGAYRLIGPKIAPGVEVLLQSPDEEPLLVVGEYGRGRTAALAVDSTWRWWRAGQKETHHRFWWQLMLWLLAREDTGGDKIVIEMDARRFAVDDPPEFRASVQSLSESNQDAELIAEVIDESGEVTPIAVTTESRSDESLQELTTAIRGRLPKLDAGFYRLLVRPRESTDSLQAEEKAFQVIDESRELAQPMADPVYLRQLAELTADHGGAAFTPDEIDGLIETIKQRRRQAEAPIVEKFRLGDGPLSGWLLFVLFAGALSTEWFLRRQWGLV
jgi:hypothetical protein